MAEELLVPMIVILAIVVVAIGALYFFTPAFKSPEQVCGEKGMIYDAKTDTCVSCAPKGSGCLLSQCCYLKNEQGQYLPMSCNWDWNPLNLFRVCG